MNPMISSDIFNCKMCGDCCEGFGGTYVTSEDIEAISEYIDTNPDRFVDQFCQFSGGKPVLAQGEDGKCIFFKKLCTIHPVKPRMCKEWPFIKSVLKDVNNWKIMSSFCKGIRTDIPEEIILKCVKAKLKK